MRDEYHREPLLSYEQAVWHLLNEYQAYEWVYDPESVVPPEARIICDLFWINQGKLIADLKRAWGGSHVG